MLWRRALLNGVEHAMGWLRQQRLEPDLVRAVTPQVTERGSTMADGAICPRALQPQK